MPALTERGNATFMFRDMTPAEAAKNEKTDTMTFMLDHYFNKYIPNVRHGVPEVQPIGLADHFKILAAATGSGKSSIGPELYLRYWPIMHKNIAVLQPTVTTALSIAQDVSGISKYRASFKMGKNLGYQTGIFVRKPVNGVVFMTTDTLGQMMRNMTDEQFMRRFGFILLDEAHKRKIELDIVVYMLKKLVMRHPNDSQVPFVMAMSGTMPVRKYADYLGVRMADIISVTVHTFEKTEHYLAHDAPDYIKATVETVMDIHTRIGKDDEPERGDIIIFVRGNKPAKAMTKMIMDACERLERKILVTKIDAVAFRVGTQQYFDVLRPLAYAKVIDSSGHKHTPVRRVILGTPAMETGLTVNTAKYCIDTGYERTILFDPVRGVDIDMQAPISKAAAIQRIGRIGRLFPGEFFMMYTEDTFGRLKDEQDPDVFTHDVSRMMLNLIVVEAMPDWDRTFMGWSAPIINFDITNMDLLDSPSADSMNHALEKLFILGLIDGNMKPTLMGCAALRFRAALENVRMIFEGYTCGANIDDLISIAAMLETGVATLINRDPKWAPVFTSPLGPTTGTLYLSCDLIELLLAWYEVRQQLRELTTGEQTMGKFKKWMRARGLVYDQWLVMIGIRDQLLMTCISMGLDPYRNGLGIGRHKYDLLRMFRAEHTSSIAKAEVRKLKQCIFAGHQLATATWDSKQKMYVHDGNGMPLCAPDGKSTDTRELTKQARPTRIIVFDIKLTQGLDGMFNLAYSASSAIDGFIEEDETFIVS
jgi:HrpA-like RNA helicase